MPVPSKIAAGCGQKEVRRIVRKQGSRNPTRPGARSDADLADISVCPAHHAILKAASSTDVRNPPLGRTPSSFLVVSANHALAV